MFDLVWRQLAGPADVFTSLFRSGHTGFCPIGYQGTLKFCQRPHDVKDELSAGGRSIDAIR